MIQEFVDRFMTNKEILEEVFKKKHPDNYQEVVENTIKIIATEDYGDIDPTRITCIDHGHYQGTQLFIIAENSYQPNEFWYVKVDYGSCSGCDTLERIKSDGDWDSETPNEQQVKDYMTLALHIVQGLKKME